MKYLFAIIFSIIALSVYAQKIENFSTYIKNGTVEIIYDLVDDHAGITYDLLLFSSLDNYTTPLTYVSGDIGKKVTPGVGKKITWNAKLELGEFKGEVYLELKGMVSPPFVRILTPNANDKLKLGKKVNIQWDSDISENMKIDLYRNGTRISEVANTTNTGNYSWSVSKTLSKAGGYYLVFTSSSAPNKQVESGQFYLSKGVPIWAVIGGVVVVGGVVAILMQPDPEPPTNGPEPNEINDPIKPGGGG